MKQPGELNFLRWALEEHHITPEKYYNSSPGNQLLLQAMFSLTVEERALANL